MSEENAPLVITLKGGKDFSDPWIVLRGSTPAEVEQLLANLGSLPEAVVSASNLFHAVNTAGPLLPNAPQAPAAPAPQPQQQAPAAPQGWQPSPQAQAAPAVQSPTGEACAACGTTLVFKSGTSKAGKAYQMFTCPNGRSRNDGHTTNWVN